MGVCLLSTVLFIGGSIGGCPKVKAAAGPSIRYPLSCALFDVLLLDAFPTYTHPIFCPYPCRRSKKRTKQSDLAAQPNAKKPRKTGEANSNALAGLLSAYCKKQVRWADLEGLKEEEQQKKKAEEDAKRVLQGIAEGKSIIALRQSEARGNKWFIGQVCTCPLGIPIAAAT